MTGAARKYLIRFGVAMGVYAVLVVVAILLAQSAGDAPWRFAAMALPVPAIAAIVWAVATYARDADEMVSTDLTRSLAIAFGAGSALTFTYGLMEAVGAPHLNWMFVWVVYGACWLAASLWVSRTRR